MSGFSSLVPKSLIKAYATLGVNELFEWQADCLSNERLFEPFFENLIYTAPTSAGKTLVAEVITACNVLKTGRRALFIYPYISSAREKLFYLQSLWRSVNLVVKAFIGASSTNLHGWSAAVCTIEKANTLINTFIELDLLAEIGIIVVDELHMIFEDERGAIVENLIGKVLYASMQKSLQIQIIGMSATLDKHKLLAKWIQAHIFVSDFRPLRLREFVLIDGVVFDLIEKRKDRVLPKEYLIKSDIKNMIGITIESIFEDKAVLIFCSTKAETEKYSMALARYFHYCMSKGERNRFYKLGDLLTSPRQREIVEYFSQKTYCTDNDLLHCIACGIAFHHAGLTVEEREEIEFLFRNGSVKVLISTSTLSSGVNLPAHRVFIMASGNSYISLNSITYRQMVGRAGRQGQCTISGESYVLCSKTDWPIVQFQIGNKQSVCSTRSTARTILEAISSEFVDTREQLEQLLKCLFSPFQNEVDVELKRLNELKLISLGSKKKTVDSGLPHSLSLINSDDSDAEVSRITPTQLGRAVMASSLSPGIAMQIFVDLDNAAKSLCLDSELHMLYLVTPIDNLAINTNAIEWNFFHQKWVELPQPLMRVARRVGVTEKFFMQKLGGKFFAKNDEALNIHIRFFAALVLFELINENSLQKVSRTFHINRGLLQSLQQQAATYAYMIVAFCDRLGWFYLKTLLNGFAERLQFGVRRDLTELVQVPGIDAIRARHFYQSGIKSLIVLANSSVNEICRVLRRAVPFPANPNVEQDKNTWLFGESPIDDIQASKIIVQRACDALRDKLELNSIPFSVFGQNKFFMDITSTSKNSNQWLSDNMTVSEFMHESAIKNLCETLSPLRIDDRLNCSKNFKESSNNLMTKNAKISKPLSSLCQSGSIINYTGDVNLNPGIKQEANGDVVQKIINENEKIRNVFENFDSENKSLLTLPHNKQPNHIDSECYEDYGEFSSFNDDNKIKSGNEKTVKIELDSLDCAEIIVGGQPLQLKCAFKKRCIDRISKDTTLVQWPFSPLNKKRTSLAELNGYNINGMSESPSLFNNSNDNQLRKEKNDKNDNTKATKDLRIKGDSFDQFWNDSLCNQFENGTVNDVSDFINDSDIIAAFVLNNESVQKNVIKENNEGKEHKNCDINLQTAFSDFVEVGCQAIIQASNQESSNEIEYYKDKTTSKNCFLVTKVSHLSTKTFQSKEEVEKNNDWLEKKIKHIERKLGKCGIEFVCRCNWSKFNFFANDNACSSLNSSNLFCGLSLIDDSVLIFAVESVRCFLLPLRRIKGSCQKCKVCDFESLLKDILSDGSIKKWFFDALQFFRPLRRIFIHKTENDFSSGQRLSAKRDRSTTRVFNNAKQPFNIGCIRTLEALNSESGFNDFLSNNEFRNKQFLPSDSIWKIAKKHGISKWNPLSKSISKDLSLSSVLLSSRIINAALEAYFAVLLACKLFFKSHAQYNLQCLYLKSLEVVVQIELAGLDFNRQRCTKMISNIAMQMSEIEKRVFRLCNGEKFNLDSPEEVSKILFVKLNLNAPGNATSTRRHFSTNSAVLKQLCHPVADAIIKWRKLQNSHSALRNLLQEAAIQASDDARIRTCFDNLGGIAGRITTSCPNLQFLPKETLVNNKYSARSVLVAPSGMVLLAADYCQLELRILGELSKDVALMRLLKDSAPVSANLKKCVASHKNLDSNISRLWEDEADGSAKLLDDPFEKISRYFESHRSSAAVSKELLNNGDCKAKVLSIAPNVQNVSAIQCDRQKTKQLCYAIIYGMGAEALGREMHISKADAQNLINQFFELFPRVKCWIDKQMLQCRERGYCETFLKRRRVFAKDVVGQKLAKEKQIGRQCINYIVQGTASEIFRQALVNVSQQLKKEFDFDQRDALPPRIVMQMHDEIIIEVAERDVKKCAQILRSLMEDIFVFRGFRFCFPVKLLMGKSWGSLTPF